MEKDRWKGLFCPENKKIRSNVMLVLFVGILLLAAGKGLPLEKTVVSEQKSVGGENVSADRMVEQRMAAFLSGIEGAGQVDVLLTYRKTTEKTIARNEIREGNGENLRTEETAVLLEDEAGATQPLVLTETGPVVEGVVIAAQGADSPAVAAALNQAAQALLDVPAHKVAVLKMK